MTKAEIVTEIATQTGIDRQQVLAVVEGMMRVVKRGLSEKKSVYLRGFGTFYAKKRAEKIGRIITKQQQIVIPEHYIPAFKPAKSFMTKVKNSYSKG